MSLMKELAGRGPRRTRSPLHDFHLRHRAFVIQPFMYLPVRPGETMKNLLWQARVVTDPLANPLMGWHLEYYFFYVQLQDTVPPGQEDVWMKPLWDNTDTFVNHWGSVVTRLENGDIVNAAVPDLTYQCYRRCVEEFFRDEGEVWNSAHKMSGALALARRPRKDAFESYAAEFGASPDVTINVADGLTFQEIVNAMGEYAMLLDTSMGAVTTFEDYLASQKQGTFSDVKRAYRPELLRVVKEWSLPTNTVDPVTGTPTSAVSWSISGRADKDRYFKEPGFIVGLTVARPKTLRLTNSSQINEAFPKGSDWMPIQTMHNAAVGFSNDHFNYGFQFVNFDAAAAVYKANQISWVPVGGGTAGQYGDYPSEASINANVWKAAASNNVRQDGRVDVSILTDLPQDQNVGASANQEPAVAEEASEMDPFESIEDLAHEYVAKLKERKAGNLKVKLPNIGATLARMSEDR